MKLIFQFCMERTFKAAQLSKSDKKIKLTVVRRKQKSIYVDIVHVFALMDLHIAVKFVDDVQFS